MQSFNNTNTNNGLNITGTITTLTKFIFIAIICILVNIPLYFMDEKWIAGLFTGAWVGAGVLLFLYNHAFQLNVTSYSLSNFFNNYIAPILVYAFWMISIYWLITGFGRKSRRQCHFKKHCSRFYCHNSHFSNCCIHRNI